MNTDPNRNRAAGVRTELAELAANFADRGAQGVRAYAEQIVLNNTGVDYEEALTEAMVTVEGFYRGLSNTAPRSHRGDAGADKQRHRGDDRRDPPNRRQMASVRDPDPAS